MATYISNMEYHQRRLQYFLSKSATVVGFRKDTGEACYRVVDKKDLDEIKEMFHMDIIAEQKIYIYHNGCRRWVDPQAEIKRLQKRYANRWREFFVQGTEIYETHLHFSLKLDPYARLFNGIKEMPREINRIIMSFLSVPIKFTLIMFTDTTYPFSPMMWNMKYSAWANFPDGRLFNKNGNIIKPVDLDGSPFDGATNRDNVAKCLFYSVLRENEQFCNNWACGWTPSKMLIVFLMRLKQDLSSLAFI